jgi:4-amino-4-deoxy-L-arabinose transferase-like glycosyltransferase
MDTIADEANEFRESLPTATVEQTTLKTQLSVADGLYVLVVLVAAVMRLSGLGRILLSPIESQEALSAWQFLQTGPNPITIGSPTFLTLTSLLMPFLGVSDVTARLVPALFGLGLVMLPWFLRSRLGQIGALLTATLFAVSPLYAAISRTAGGDAIALFAILLVTIAGLRLRYGGSDIWLYALAGAIGLGLASSPLIYSGLITLAIAWFAQRLVSPEPEQNHHLERTKIIKAAIFGGLVLIALSTRFFTHLPGFGSSAQMLGDWLAQFSWQGDLQTLLSPFLVLGRYEIVLLPLGIFAIIWAIWRNHPLGTLFTYWLLASMILMLLQHGVLNNALLVPLSGYLLIGLASDHLLRRGRSRWTWAVTGMIILLGAIVLVNVARFLRVSLIEQQVANLWISIMALAAAVLLIYYYWREHEKAIMQGLWLGVMILSLLYQWGTAWNLTHVTANDPRESWVVQATDDDVAMLALSLQDISRKAANSDGEIPIFSAVDSPVLRWYLRDFGQAEFGQTLPPGAKHEVIISSAMIIEPALGDDYLGGDFGLLRGKAVETSLSPTPLLDTLRWVLFHESSRGVIEERIILWVRADLVRPQ